MQIVLGNFVHVILLTCREIPLRRATWSQTTRAIRTCKRIRLLRYKIHGVFAAISRISSSFKAELLPQASSRRFFSLTVAYRNLLHHNLKEKKRIKKTLNAKLHPRVHSRDALVFTSLLKSSSALSSHTMPLNRLTKQSLDRQRLD